MNFFIETNPTIDEYCDDRTQVGIFVRGRCLLGIFYVSDEDGSFTAGIVLFNIGMGVSRFR